MRFRIWVTLGCMGCGSVSAVPKEQGADVRPPMEDATSPVESDGMQAVGADLRGLELGDATGRPVLIALHGRGDHPSRFARLAENWSDVAHVVVPAATIPFGTGFSWFNIRAGQDDPTLAAAVAEATRRVVQLVHARRNAEHPVVVTGFSQGGMLSFVLATRPEKVVDAAVPMGGFLPKHLWPEALPAHATPILAVHGEADTVLPVTLPRETVAHLEGLGWPVRLYTEPGVGHTISRGMMREVDGAVRRRLVRE